MSWCLPCRCLSLKWAVALSESDSLFTIHSLCVNRVVNSQRMVPFIIVTGVPCCGTYPGCTCCRVSFPSLDVISTQPNNHCCCSYFDTSQFIYQHLVSSRIVVSGITRNSNTGTNWTKHVWCSYSNHTLIVSQFTWCKQFPKYRHLSDSPDPPVGYSGSVAGNQK